MARMRPCRVCGNQMASSAKACPSCGAKNKKPIFRRLWFILLLIIIVAVIVVTSSTQQNRQASVPQEPGAVPSAVPAPEIIKVSAADLIKAYNDNEVRADSTHKNKQLTVSGIVTSISVVLGQTNVTIGTGEMFELGIICYPLSGQDEKIAALNKGDSIAVTGKCDGKSLSVVMKQCQFK